jgi:prepilin-type N-terminal cleavage/methylation domain-containing protein
MAAKNPKIKKRNPKGILAKPTKNQLGLPQKNQTHKKAFSLIEILIVVAIISLLTGIAIPAINNAKAKSQEIKRKTIETAVETAKNRYSLSRDDTQHEGQNATFAHIRPYLLINGKSPIAFEEIGHKAQNKAGANIISLGTYWSPDYPAQTLSWGEEPPSE